MSHPVEAGRPPKSEFPATAAFFDLDKTLIARSSTLAFGPPFYRHGLLSRTDMLRGAAAQLRYRVSGADHRQMEKLRAQVGRACQGWLADQVTEIVSRYLKDLILPYVYAEARALLSEHRGAGQDVVIVSTSGEEVVAPIGAMLGVHSVIATRMRIADGRYTGEMECYAYGEEKAVQVRRLAAERGYSLPDCYAYTDSVTDLPLLEIVGHPRVVNPDRALRRIATAREWPVLSFCTI
ncbi:MAG TPA: HAD family hydrolase [Streptosporangiaceae bacterium]|nr:HAD family hydrolase [Streptosporangiaceae bacterium]